ncbi:MAG TPA: 6-phosphofructokinase [Clostridiales bacterium]|nr:6-phosphofructokinase [Clostridiales bacterium]
MGGTRALIALGGGPSPVINSSLLGALERCLDYPDRISKVYAAWHGIEGVLLEELMELGCMDPYELALLHVTPASGAAGTCRYKLGESREEDFERILEVFTAHDIGYFFYIGGNDSMDTADKISGLARQRGINTIVTGIPKTIDNDLGDDRFTLIDHTPGYGSAARYWTGVIQSVEEENRGMCVSEPVAVLQAMGRKSGYITAAARLADPDREIPLQLYFAEANHNLETLTENVNRELMRSGRCIVVVNEGFDVGDLGEARDGFGHIEYGASRTTAAQVVVNHLNKVGLRARGQATGQVPGILQRAASIFRSTTDMEEARTVAAHAVDIAMQEGTGYMATLLRKSETDYCIAYDKVDLRTMANSARYLPKNWITSDGLDVTDDFVKYARPLIGNGWPDIPIQNGLQRFARLNRVFVEKKCKTYIPVGFRP